MKTSENRLTCSLNVESTYLEMLIGHSDRIFIVCLCVNYVHRNKKEITVMAILVYQMILWIVHKILAIFQKVVLPGLLEFALRSVQNLFLNEKLCRVILGVS
jgi:di/tricarboxylate transporter